MQAPSARCEVDPTTFAVAESLGRYGKGICTVENAYRITVLEGVRFSQPAIINCAVANGMRRWLREIAQPAAQQVYGQRVTSLTVAASYACRARNGRRGAKLSEHGFGNAIDISAIQFENGQQTDVRGDYYASKFLQRIRQAACGVFATVLGPGSDAYHRDHLHFDLANRRSGQAFCG